MSAAKKRSPAKGKGGGQRRGLSGNPQRRAEQLRDKRPSLAHAGAMVTPPAAGPAAPDPSVMRELAYRMAGGADPAPWWRESHDRVLARARAASWPRRDVEIEDLTCQIVGGELFDCFERYAEGHNQGQWLVSLTEAAGAALRSSLADGDGSGACRGLASLLSGIALTVPRTPAGAPDDRRLLARRYFPDIKDPYDTALAAAGEAAQLLADRGVAAVAAAPGGGCRAAGAPLVARDEYGSRFLLAAPFRYDGYDGKPADHWYAWDIDTCWIDSVVGAGTFGSAAGALAEWQEAVGPRASGAVLAECPPGLTARLLAQSLQTGPFSEFMDGDEPRELIREYYRERRRACELAESLGDLTGGAGSFVIDVDKARDEFLEWYAARHGADSLSSGMADSVNTITDQWGPHKDVDDRVFYACSPHRIEAAAHLIREELYPEHAGAAIRLLPDWTQWCIERNGLSGDAAARARGAAMSAASALTSPMSADASAAMPRHAASAPFRRPE